MDAVIPSIPIIFSGDRILRLLDGTKTQTRRIIEPQPIQREYDPGVWLRRCGRGKYDLNIRRDTYRKPGEPISSSDFLIPVKDWLLQSCRFKVGQQLWVKEGWGIGGARLIDPCINYRSDGGQLPLLSEGFDGWKTRLSQHVASTEDLLSIREGWRSPIHMPRWASRLTLEVTEVRIQGLNEITREDAMAEGIDSEGGDDEHRNRSTLENFAKSWDSIHGEGAWASNPFVAAITFKKVAK